MPSIKRAVAIAIVIVNYCYLLQDICGIICAVMTWLLILYAEFVVMVVIILPSPYPVYSTINMVIFNMLAFLAYASHIRTMFSDPVSINMRYGFILTRLTVWIGLVCLFLSSRYLGRCTERQCYKRNDSTIRFQRRSGIFQVSKMLQHQARTSASLQCVPTMHTEDGSSLSMVMIEFIKILQLISKLNGFSLLSEIHLF